LPAKTLMWATANVYVGHIWPALARLPTSGWTQVYNCFTALW